MWQFPRRNPPRNARPPTPIPFTVQSVLLLRPMQARQSNLTTNTWADVIRNALQADQTPPTHARPSNQRDLRSSSRRPRAPTWNPPPSRTASQAGRAPITHSNPSPEQLEQPSSPPRPPFAATHTVSVIQRRSPWRPTYGTFMSCDRARWENTWLRIRRWTLEIDWCVYVEDDSNVSRIGEDGRRLSMVEVGKEIEDVKEKKREMERRSRCGKVTCEICNPKQGGFGYW